MAEGRAEQVAALFKEAIERDEGEWEPFLQRACANDAVLRAELKSLLLHHRTGREFLEQTAAELTRTLNDRDKLTPGECVQPYRIDALIGEGGMGVVYLAEDMRLHRKVALKLVNAGFGSGFIRHFRNEERILAALNHPNIARLYDGGATDDGRPFFAMEYVDGTRIDEYCREKKVPLRERLELFRKVCAAVAYAHRHLVIHRDLKPANIRVTSEGEPKLLDFGIAKLLNPENSTGEQTVTLQTVMTPDYASPEQVRGETMTTASDVYSLGVVLYELLSGQRVYRLTTRSAAEISRVIGEETPERPSVALLRDPQRSSQEARSLRGDLDNIVLMALRKEPERRYSSVGALSEDIRRYLVGRPVLARKDTLGYRATKFAQRHRAGVAASALLVLAIIAGMAGTIWQARAAARQRDHAQFEKARAESVSRFLERTLSYSNPVVRPEKRSGRETTMTEVLNDAARRLKGGEFSNQPEIKAELLRIVGLSYGYGGKRELMWKYLREYLALEMRLHGPDDPRTLEARAIEAERLFADGDLTRAETIFRATLPKMRSQLEKGTLKPRTLVDALSNFGYLRRTQGDSAEAEKLFREVLRLSDRIDAESYYLIGTTRCTLASSLADQGKFEKAVTTAQDAVLDYRRRGLTKDPDYAFALTVLGGFLIERDQITDGAEALHEAESILRSGPSPPLWLGDNLRNQAIALYRQGRWEDARAKAEQSLRIYRESFSPAYDQYPTVLIVRGLARARLGQISEGESNLREALRIRQQQLPQDHFWTAMAEGALGECLTIQKRFAEAEPLLLRSYTNLKKSQGSATPRTRLAGQRLIALYESWGKPDRANQYRAELRLGKL